MTAVVGRLEEQVGDEEDGRRHRDREQHRAGDREAIGDQQQALLVAIAEANPVEGGRRDQEDGAADRAEQRDHVGVLLQVGHVARTAA